MLKKSIYLILVVLLAAIAFILWRNSGSETEIQKLKAQIYDLQKQVEKQNDLVAETKITENKEERKINPAVTAPSQTPPSVVRPAHEEYRNEQARIMEPRLSTADSNDFAQSLTDIQEEVEKQALMESLENVAEVGETNAAKTIDMSQIDAIIREAEEKLVAQYGEKILEKEKVEKISEEISSKGETAKEIIKEIKREAVKGEKDPVRKIAEQRDFASKESEGSKKNMTEVMISQEKETQIQAAELAENAAAFKEEETDLATNSVIATVETKEQIVEKPSWQEDELPGARPVESTDTHLTYVRGPQKIENNYDSGRGQLRPVHGDSVNEVAQPSFYQNSDSASTGGSPSFNVSGNSGSNDQGNAGAAPQTVTRTSSLRPASEVIVPLKAREEVERDIRAEEARRRPPDRVRRIPAKNYNALGNKTMSDVMKEGMK